MAEVILKNIKKIYPHQEPKKKKKGEPEKKNNLQITEEGVLAVDNFNLHIQDKEFIVLVGPSGCGKSLPPEQGPSPPLWGKARLPGLRPTPPADSTAGNLL